MLRSPLGKRSALQVGMVELHAAQGEQGPSSGQTPPLPLLSPEMLLSLASNAHRLEAEKLCNFLALCISLFALQRLCLLLVSEPGALHKGNCFNFFPSHTDLCFISTSKG